MTEFGHAFGVIAEPTRREILGLLASGERSVGELQRQLRISQPGVSKHLRVLRDAGLVESRVEAQHRVYKVRPEPLREMDAWLAPFRRLWASHLDALARHLDSMDEPPSRKRKKRR
jgi:DNA-binding transcriptional ArsR family regulator